MLKKRTIGLMKNKISLLSNAKEERQKRINRQSLIYQIKQYFHRFKKVDESKQIQLNPSLLGQGNKSAESTSSNFTLEMSTPPVWMTIYQETNDKFQKIREISQEIQILATKRIKIQFGDASALEKQIYDLNSKATSIIFECERNMEQMNRITLEGETESDLKIKQNIQRSMAQQIQELTNNLRNQQKRMVTLITQINKDDGGFSFFLLQFKANFQNFLNRVNKIYVKMIYQHNRSNNSTRILYRIGFNFQIQPTRDQDINRLVDMINDLAQVFKSLNQLVIDQGTIVDRIDYNIDQAMQNVKKANVHLRKADEYQDSPMARRCIMFLVFMIIVFCIILTAKYSKTQ